MSSPSRKTRSSRVQLLTQRLAQRLSVGHLASRHGYLTSLGQKTISMHGRRSRVRAVNGERFGFVHRPAASPAQWPRRPASSSSKPSPRNACSQQDQRITLQPGLDLLLRPVGVLVEGGVAAVTVGLALDQRWASSCQRARARLAPLPRRRPARRCRPPHSPASRRRRPGRPRWARPRSGRSGCPSRTGCWRTPRRWAASRGGEVHGLVKRALVRGAVTEERQHDAA